MTDRKALWTQNGSTSAEEDRALIAALIGSNGGVFKTTDLKVTATGTPDMNVHVAAGRCAILGTESSSLQGVYLGWLDASKTVAIAAADATNDRIDLVVAKIQDQDYSGSTDAFSVVAVTGTPSGSPAVPTAPANSVVLAQVAVGHGVSSISTGNITDKRTPCGAGHRFPTVASTSLYPATVSDGLAVYRASGDANEGPEFYNGSAWRKAWNQPWGVVGTPAIVTSSSQTFTTIADLTSFSVTFTAVANRYYKTTAFVSLKSTIAGDIIRFEIDDGSSTRIALNQQVVSGAGVDTGFSVATVETIAAGSVTRKLRGSRVSGTGTCSVSVAANNVGMIVVEDIGPSGAPS